MLVPPHPDAVLVCRYWGFEDSGPRWTLAGQRYASRSGRLERLVTELDALEPISAPFPSCPSAGGRSVLLVFGYRHAPEDPVRIVREACNPVSNGWLKDRYGLGLPTGVHWLDEGLI